MKQKKAKVSYVFEDDIFVARPLKRRYDSSFQIGNFIFDLDKDSKVIGLEIINASKIFNISKVFIKSIISGNLEIIVTEQYIRVDINFKTRVRNADNTNTLSIERVRPEFINQTELRLAIA